MAEIDGDDPAFPLRFDQVHPDIRGLTQRQALAAYFMSALLVGEDGSPGGPGPPGGGSSLEDKADKAIDAADTFIERYNRNA